MLRFVGRKIMESLGALVWPPRCYLCGRGVLWSETLCEGCYGVFMRALVCGRCGSRLSDPDVPCAQCVGVRPHWDGFFAGYRYEEPLKGIFASAKYYGSSAALRVMADMAFRFWRGRAGPDVSFVTWVAPDPRRLWERGYDVAREVARGVAKALGLPLRATLKKLRSTPPQAGRTEAQRKAALAGAFALTSDVNGSKVLLVDDLATTCTTLRRCVRVLKRGGARVVCFVLAR